MGLQLGVWVCSAKHEGFEIFVRIMWTIRSIRGCYFLRSAGHDGHRFRLSLGFVFFFPWKLHGCFPFGSGKISKISQQTVHVGEAPLPITTWRCRMPLGRSGAEVGMQRWAERKWGCNDGDRSGFTLTFLEKGKWPVLLTMIQEFSEQKSQYLEKNR